MPIVKLHLDDEEYAPVARLAEQLKVRPEDVVFSGLNMLMMKSKEVETRADVPMTKLWHRENLPQWSDSARSVHAYEGKADHHSEIRFDD